MRVVIGVLSLLTVGFACSGPGTSAISVCSPPRSTGELDSQAAGSPVVAPDESHVAFLRDLRTFDAGCIARGAQLTTGILVVLSLQPDGSSCERVVANDVVGFSIFFSSDSQGLVFRNEPDDCGVGKLKRANADGANVRVVHESVTNNVAVGSTVFFDAQDETHDLAAPIAGGTPVSLGPRSWFGPTVPSSNATGTAFAYAGDGSGDGPASGSLTLFELPSGESRTVSDGATDYAGNSSWSSRGGWLAFCHQPLGAPNWSLALIAADGKARTEVSANCVCDTLTFAPDDSWLAYHEPDSSGGTRLMTYSLKDGSKVALGVLPAGYAQSFFSGDGVNVVTTVDTPTSVATSIYGATAGVGGSLQFLIDTLGDASLTTAGGGHVAVEVEGGIVDVFPVSGGDPVALAGLNPQFESGVSQPHLLVWQSAPSAIGVAAADGTAATFQGVPDTIQFASWLGSAAVYGTAPEFTSEPMTMTISALTNAGMDSTQLAKGAGAYGWAPIAAPTRLFYSRAAPSADGPVGLWIVELPR